MPGLPHVLLRVLPKMSLCGSQGRATGGEGGLPSPLQGLHCCGFFSALATPGFPVPRGFTPEEPALSVFFQHEVKSFSSL